MSSLDLILNEYNKFKNPQILLFDYISGSLLDRFTEDFNKILVIGDMSQRQGSPGELLIVENDELTIKILEGTYDTDVIYYTNCRVIDTLSEYNYSDKINFFYRKDGILNVVENNPNFIECSVYHKIEKIKKSIL